MLTSAPSAPSATRSSATTSAANPLPIPPRSNAEPAGTVRVDRPKSTTMSSLTPTRVAATAGAGADVVTLCV